MTVPQVPPSPTNPANAAQCKYERTPTWEKVLAIVGVSAALIYAGISLMMWCEMQKQTGILNRQFVSNDRAWIGVGSSSIPYPVTYPDGPNKPVFTVRYTLKNVGHSPAFVDVKGRIFYSKSGEWRREQEELCNAAFEKAKSVGRKWGKDAYTILPGDEMPYDVTYDDRGDGAVRLTIENPPQTIVPFNVGCILYRSMADEEVRITPFVASISSFAGTIGNQQPIRFDGQSIPAEKLKVLNVLTTGDTK